jgi:hypothetical protein
MSKNKTPKTPKADKGPKKERKTPAPRLVKPQMERSLNGFTRALNSIGDSFSGRVPDALMDSLRRTREALANVVEATDPTELRKRGERHQPDIAEGTEVHFNKSAHKSLKGLVEGATMFRGYAPGTGGAMAHVAVLKSDGSELPLCVPTAYLRKRPELS